MTLQKNKEGAISNICEVGVRSFKFAPDYSFHKIYGTPNSIKFLNSSQKTKSGTLYNYKIQLLYPGLKESDFFDFHRMLKDKYSVRIKTVQQEVYEVGNKIIPLEMKINFKSGSGTEITFYNKSLIPVRFVDDGFPYALTFSL
ncbi:hypothetical protein [Aureivirga marina]|uniref:hypothetical protein n=1 Tax=Aureivirga marina TaxID=1182451 RepID=UPI0018CA3A4D|nr:hypothetical protein [Aureivirga marina]